VFKASKSLCIYDDFSSRLLSDPLFGFRAWAIAKKCNREMSPDDTYIFMQAASGILKAPLHTYMQLFSLLLKHETPTKHFKEVFSLFGSVLPVFRAPLGIETINLLNAYWKENLDQFKAYSQTNYHLMTLMLLAPYCYHVEKMEKDHDFAIIQISQSLVNMFSPKLNAADALLLSKRLDALLPSWYEGFKRFRQQAQLSPPTQAQAPALMFSSAVPRMRAVESEQPQRAHQKPQFHNGKRF
jgi:hypothetical protein